MQIRQEQAVFAVVVVLIGVLLATEADDPGGGRSRRRSGDSPELVRHSAPDAERLVELAGLEAGARPLMSPPRDTQPLEPLDFEAPPLPPLVAPGPPPVPGPAPEHQARLLQRMPPSYDVEGLFDVVDGETSGADLAALLADLERGESDLDLEGLVVGAQGQGLDELLGAGTRTQGEAFLVENQFLDAEERRQREASYYRLYDSIRLGETGVRFGRIENEDPYSLRSPARALEPIRFLEFDADRGTPRFGSAPPIDYERDRVLDFALADTLENRLRARHHELRGEVGPASVEPMLALAADCLEVRLEFPEGLELAESLYRRVDQARPDDPRAGVGLARTYEARFDFERATNQYEELRERFPLSAEVLAGLAELERRFRLFDAAEEHLREAIAVERSSHLGHAGLGRLLLGRGRYAEARAALEDAFTRIPAGVGAGRARQSVRLDLGATLLALGEVGEAGKQYRDALRAEQTSQTALAGVAACALLGDAASRAELPAWFTAGDPPPADAFDALGHELLLAGGLWALEEGRLADAVRDLRAAAQADPLRAAAAHRALSWVAEVAGDPETALERIEAALLADPTDAWSHHQRGRLMLARDELEEAAEAFRRTLELEVDHEDALIGSGLVAWRRARSAEAELYFERAIALVDARLAAVAAGADARGAGAEPRADVHALRGMNLLDLGEYLRARDAFDAALAIEPRQPLALAGLAWAIYRLGDTDEALIQLRSIDDTLRARPEDDPLRVWARGQIDRLTLHEAQDVWIDDFEYSTLGNGWERREAAGPRAALDGGELVLAGNFKTIGEARYQRIYEASKFISIQARVKVSGDSNARAGLFVSRETGTGDRSRVQAYAAVARSRDGVAQVRTVVPGREQDAWIDLPAEEFPFPADEWVRLAIERRGDGSETTVTIYVDGIPVLEDVPMTNLARGNNAIQVGLFAEGDTGRKVEVRMDDVEVVRTRAGR